MNPLCPVRVCASWGVILTPERTHPSGEKVIGDFTSDSSGDKGGRPGRIARTTHQEMLRHYLKISWSSAMEEYILLEIYISNVCHWKLSYSHDKFEKRGAKLGCSRRFASARTTQFRSEGRDARAPRSTAARHLNAPRRMAAGGACQVVRRSGSRITNRARIEIKSLNTTDFETLRRKDKEKDGLAANLEAPTTGFPPKLMHQYQKLFVYSKLRATPLANVREEIGWKATLRGSRDVRLEAMNLQLKSNKTPYVRDHTKPSAPDVAAALMTTAVDCPQRSLGWRGGLKLDVPQTETGRLRGVMPRN
ncbi:hypothetical protein EVAR_2594_1 [Eumeta japonica]|uniref:Uncharacterized protein n=1 Tax=Eumeta variegata TaxID=151549 RepID=A0A4C1SPH2_EUMVA|nr:hypothetical protein EVAR_2594_1 [Eumeta japonica]